MLTAHQIELLAKLSKLLKSRKIRQTDLADATGVHQSQISRIISGHVRRASQNVLKLCKYADSLGTQGESEESSIGNSMDALLELTGKSVEEDAALRQIVAGLRAWRLACTNRR